MEAIARFGTAVLLLGCLALPACDADSPIAPSGSLSGTWRGQVTDDTRGAGTLEMSLTDADPGLGGRTISGAWTWSFNAGAILERGCVFGVVTETNINLSLFVTGASCTGQVGPPLSVVTALARLNDDHLVGDYQQTTASPSLLRGNFDLTLRN